MSGKKPGFYYCDLWKMNFYYFIGWSPEAYEDYINKKYDYKAQVTGDGSCIFIDNEEGFMGNCIWIRHKEDFASLAHECLHAACNTLRVRGWAPDLLNEEPLAYLVELIARKSNLKVK